MKAKAGSRAGKGKDEARDGAPGPRIIAYGPGARRKLATAARDLICNGRRVRAPPRPAKETRMTDAATPSRTEVAVLGGGCFWCLDAVFRDLAGVLSVESGYAGGERPHPTYEAVCTGATGHAEVVRVTFDPDALPFRDLLAVFFTIHDPTTLNRQGNDVGTQYRSVIFAQTPEQKAIAQDVVRTLAREQLFDKPIVTEIADAAPFYAAEGYHQDYFENNPNQPYCMFVVGPKVAKFRKAFAERRKATR
jgi:peptide-methionine (S)-S-oxide reductase